MIAPELTAFGSYGTFEGHAESGEERFTVDWNQANDKVCYDIPAFSGPREMLARIGYPLSRSLQKNFAKRRQSCGS